MATQQQQGFLDVAFLQLSFAIKIWNYLASHESDPGGHPFNLATFDCDLIVRDWIGQVLCPNNQFETFQDVQLASENNITVCFGAAAITLWETIRQKNNYLTSAPAQLRSDKEKIAGLSYMIRCCFAHDMARPKWEIANPKYRITYSIGNKAVNLQSLHDKNFEYSDIGGFETLGQIRADAELKGML